MIPGLLPLAPNTVGFLAAAGSLILLAWSPWRRWFLQALVTASLLVAATWLRPLDAVALFAFLAVPYMAAAAFWGRKDAAIEPITIAVLAWQVALFLIVKRYAWFDVLGYLDYPVSMIGVSYIMFRQIHLIVNAPFLGHLPFGMTHYLGFMLSPWTLIAGPIQQYDAFCNGLEHIGRPENADLLKDFHRIVNGLIKAFVFAPLFLEPSKVTLLTQPDADWIDFFVVLYGYPVYLYLNFSGYVDVVIGSARLAGFTTLPENFNRPYLARNPADFWTRWHISFGIWVRHYVFTPLSLKLIQRTSARWEGLMMALAVMITFFLVGAWHGTTSNFIAFGLLQGGGVVTASSFGRWLKRRLGAERNKALENHQGVRWASVFVCFHFTCATFLTLNNSIDEIIGSLGVFLF